jgi:hypothetical protein
MRDVTTAVCRTPRGQELTVALAGEGRPQAHHGDKPQGDPLPTCRCHHGSGHIVSDTGRIDSLLFNLPMAAVVQVPEEALVPANRR